MIFVITNDVLNATVPFPRGDNLMKIVHFQRPGKSPIGLIFCVRHTCMYATEH